MGVPVVRQERERGESLFKETMTENFQNLRKDMAIQFHETQRILPKIKTKGLIPRYIIVKISKVKDKEF